ncbi:chromosome segregation protein SMC [Propionibacterium acidifaciens]|nr:chromosome segregation protein SMC [Propionibacterium acidifaciens]AYW77043.1 chromosome segregation protein SMC [Propionibacterium acidifaciens]
MYLKSLTLKGFKSFASATTLTFEPGITAIVGPNGSGKSNIVDALAWVMGEQGAKHLRGGKMDDVIFAGTAGRAPLGRAEVTLTIDNTDGVLPIDYTEVTISRTLFRAGGSEYAINGQTARLLDVQELLSDTGMGREMHVIVGQGQLDQILQATPEMRRGFIEEAAGVLKHRRRREKAVRKLDSTAANLDRLNDLISEIRRQLKPLGRQAAVARRAAVVQAELRDARARLMADDLTAATLALESGTASAATREEQRRRAEERLEAARRVQARAETEAAAAQPALTSAQERWYAASTLRERVATVVSISAERMRHRVDDRPGTNGRDPDELDAEAAQVREAEADLRAEIEAARSRLADAGDERSRLEDEHAEAEKGYAARLRAVADRREGLARLGGQVSALRSRLEAGAEETERLSARRDEALERAAEADRRYLALETRITGLGEGESDLDAAYEDADSRVAQARERVERYEAERVGLDQRVATLSARIDALELGLERGDGAAALAGRDGLGVLGPLDGLVAIEPGWEAALAAALGPASEALAVADLDGAQRALALLGDEELGTASLLVADAPDGGRGPHGPVAGARRLDELVTAGPEVGASLRRLLAGVVAVEDLAGARAVVEEHPDLVAVTRSGELLSSWFAAGGSGPGKSAIELRAAVAAAREELEEARREAERVRFSAARADEALAEAERAAGEALARLNESDAAMSALAEQISQAGQDAESSRAEAERLAATIDRTAAGREAAEQELEVLTERLARAGDEAELTEPDPSVRDELAAAARLARQNEMEARLALRTGEERARALAGRADSLARSAARERRSRAEAAARAERARREAAVAACVHEAAVWLAARVAAAREAADAERRRADAERVEAETALVTARHEARDRAAELDELVEGSHRDEMARIEQRMRLEQLTEKAMSELGMEAGTLLAEYGPDKLVPVLTRPDGSALTADDEVPEPVPFDREEQTRRARRARRTLDQLGRINPLALEEFDALNERHQFLATQLEDLRKTRKDLQDIITEIDDRVQEVFTRAHADVARTFDEVFPRLFPGGEGHLVLTEPDDMLATGVDIEARPAGKKVKRMSLLSGGERSLVAVAFLFSLFIARSSPFYILDEVEAALDDMNLSRLLGIYEELRKDSQLLVITHQKRTMEKADALYGVTMRGDGVTTVISQRLAE